MGGMATWMHTDLGAAKGVCSNSSPGFASLGPVLGCHATIFDVWPLGRNISLCLAKMLCFLLEGVCFKLL